MLLIVFGEKEDKKDESLLRPDHPEEHVSLDRFSR